MSGRREGEEHQEEDSWGEASLTPGRLQSLPLATSQCAAGFFGGGNASHEASISQVPGQSVPRHIRPRTVLKGVAWAGTEEMLGQQADDKGPLAGLLLSPWWQGLPVQASGGSVFPFPAALCCV